MQLSIIILNYNVRFFLEQCVISAQKSIQDIDAEIIVVDNNSADDSCQMMKSRFPTVQLIENKENSGFPKGNNIGVAVAKGDYICILNPDTVVAEDTFIKILNFINSNKIGKENLGIVGCKLIDGNGKFLPESKRGIPTPFVAFSKIFGLYKISNYFGKYYAQHLNQNETGKVEILVGAFMVMKRDLYLEIGGFDENCFMYSDDIDLSYRVLKIGKSNYYFPETTVIHYKGESTVKDATYMKRFQEAMNFFYKKHFKISLAFSLFMKIGILFFSTVKMFQGKQKTKHFPDHYILISDNNDLRDQIENKFNKKVIIKKLQDLINENLKTEIIFDANYIDFEAIINYMDQNKNANFTFKIMPKNSDYIIGSNNSNDRGEIIMLPRIET